MTARAAGETGPTTAHEDAAHAARSGAIQFLAALGQGMLSLQQILVARLFGQAALGLYQTAVALVEIATRAGLAGTDKAMLRFISAHRTTGDRDLENRALGGGLRRVAWISGALAIGLGLCGGPIASAYHQPLLTGVIAIMAPCAGLTAVMVVLVAATLGAKITRISLVVRGLAEPGLLLIATGVAWLLGAGISGLAAAHLCTYATTLALAAWACARLFGSQRLRSALRAPRHSEIAQFANPLGISEVMNAVLQRADVLILNLFVGPRDVAVYVAAEFLCRSIASVRYAFDSVAAPMLSEALVWRDRPRLRGNLALMTRWVLLAAAPVAATMIALRRELLTLYGPGFGAGAGAMVLLAVAHLINGAMGLTPHVLVMSGRSRLFLVNNTGAAALNILLGIVLIPRMGIVGAAVSALLSVASLQLALAIEVWLLEKVHAFHTGLGKPVIAATAAFFAERAFEHASLPGGVRISLAIVAGGLVYLAVLIALGLGDHERRLITGIFRRSTRAVPPGGGRE